MTDAANLCYRDKRLDDTLDRIAVCAVSTDLPEAVTA